MEAEAALSRFLRVLLPIAVLNTIATGMLWPTLPKIILANFNGDSARASIFLGSVTALNAGLDLFANPMLGALSDSYGRRVMLLQSLTVSCGCNLLVAASPTLPAIVCAKIAFGLTNITRAVGYSMIIDLSHSTAPSARIHSFGAIGLAVGIGHAIGPLVGGIIADKSPRAACAASGIVMVRVWVSARGRRLRTDVVDLSLLFPTRLQIIATCLAHGMLPETLSEASRRPIGVKAMRAVWSMSKLRVFAHRPLAPFCVPFVLRRVARSLCASVEYALSTLRADCRCVLVVVGHPQYGRHGRVQSLVLLHGAAIRMGGSFERHFSRHVWDPHRDIASEHDSRHVWDEGARGGAVSCHPRATSPLATSPPSPPLASPCRKPPTHHRYVRGGTVAQGALLRRLVPQHFTSAQVCIAGYFTNALVFALYGLCRKGWALFSVLPLCGIASLSDPVLRSTMTSHVSPEEQGLFQVRCRARWSQVKCARGLAHS